MKKFCSIFFVYGVHLFFAEIFFGPSGSANFNCRCVAPFNRRAKPGRLLYLYTVAIPGLQKLKCATQPGLHMARLLVTKKSTGYCAAPIN